MLAVVAALWALNACRVAYVTGVHLDFDTFRRSTLAWTGGRQPYGGLLGNLNPPHFLLLFWPLALVAPDVGFSLWTALNVLAGAWALWRVSREVDATRRLPLVAAALCFSGVVAQCVTGNLGGLLAAIMTAAWIDDRRNTRHNGLWLGIAAAFKPFVGLVLVTWTWRRQWRAIAIALAASLACVLAGVMVQGPALYLEWLDALRDISWYSNHLNPSIWRFVWKLPPLPRALIWLLTATTMTLVSVRLPGREYQWGATMLACLWLSPLGWLYYGWIALGPVAVLWPCLNRAARWTALTALCVPPVWPELSLVYPMGFLLLWLAVVVAAQRHGAEREVVRAHTLS